MADEVKVPRSVLQPMVAYLWALHSIDCHAGDCDCEVMRLLREANELLTPSLVAAGRWDTPFYPTVYSATVWPVGTPCSRCRTSHTVPGDCVG